MIDEIIKHYDKLIDLDNDPVRDPQPLKQYMDKWDGQDFINKMELNNNKSVLEIGVGTGRIAIKVAPLCKDFLGVDVSPKTIERAKENLNSCHNISLVCEDFLKYTFTKKFDVIYSSLTFMHIKEKQFALNKISSLLNNGGKFVLSIDKNQDRYIDIGINRIKIFPDRPDKMQTFIKEAKLNLLNQYETESAYIFVCLKNYN